MKNTSGKIGITPQSSPSRAMSPNSLSQTHPEIAKQWHKTKNKALRPDAVSQGSMLSVWWQCLVEKSHTWESTIDARTRAKGDYCPFCTGRKACKTNSLAAKNPEVAKRWHPKKNGKLTPHDVTPSSGKTVWWLCSEDKTHEWQAFVISVTKSKHEGCPFCAGRRIASSKTNSLSITHPEIASEWHETKNRKLTALEVTAGSSRKVWWKCHVDAGHVYTAKVSARTTGRKCPYCRQEKSLSVTHPQLANEWHHKKNQELSPADISPGSKLSVWWQCAISPNHAWRATVAGRVLNQSTCPFCDKKKWKLADSLAKTNPKLAKEWHPEKNAGLTPADVTKSTSKKVWWLCRNYSSHSWLAPVSHRTNGHGCPKCAGRVVCDENSLANLFPGIAAEWHPSKNGELTPSLVTSGAAKIVWWQCSKSAHHVWKCQVAIRTHGNGCPFCAGKMIGADNSLQYVYPLVAQHWHKTLNGDLSPKDIAPRSNKKFWWKCPEGHVWEASVNNVVRSRLMFNSNGCRKCAYLDRSVNNAQSLKTRTKALRGQRIAQHFEDQEGGAKLDDPTIIKPARTTK